ncbi:MAG: two-component system NtrC family sensor kinase [Spirosomataceae bacterium]|jgi:signal transduction histidine kinase
MKTYSILVASVLFFVANFAFGQDGETREYAGGIVKFSDDDPFSKSGRSLSDTLKVYDKWKKKTLNHNWRVVYKDDSTFKSADFNDKAWKKADIDKSYRQLTDIQSDTVAWFRKNIYVDSATVGVPLLFDVKAAGAWEFYIDGELQSTFGKIDGERTTLINRLAVRIPYIFKRSGEHQLTYRFLFDATAKIYKSADVRPLSLVVRKADQDSFQRDIFDIKEAIGIVIGLFLLATIIHWFFYFQFKTDKRDAFNLFLSISMFCFTCYGYISSPSIRTFTLDLYVTQEVAEGFLFTTGHCLLLIAVHKYLAQKSKVLLWVTVALVFTLGLLANFFLDKSYSTYRNIAMVLIVLGFYVYLVIKAKRQNVKSSKTLLNALLYFLIVFVSVICIFIVVAGYIGMTRPENINDYLGIFVPLFIIIVLAGPQLAVSFAISADLAKEFVQTNKTLHKKVREIEYLSHEKEEILKEQNKKLEELVNVRTSELNQTVSNLKSTQAQLVQSEKLASLGELTAGIAHEIQNPLNFVNNFSEVSEELVEEVLEERVKEKDQRDEKLEEELLTDLKENLKKINHHGNRASSIVKSMLEHSRMSTGEKAQTNINALADEYLRLAYHGLRAKDRSFNAKMETHFDESLPEVSIVSQDIGRVFLNIINNAFQAPAPADAPEDYIKQITISTQKIGNNLQVTIEDNGIGIPDEIKDKVFQPFFTTKKTGEGTGLGLSLAYDIITKSHSGTIEVNSVKNQGTQFVIELPMQ